MNKAKLLPIVATAGVLLAVGVALRSNAPRPAAIPVAQPAEAPYKTYIGGAGLVEANNDNISSEQQQANAPLGEEGRAQGQRRRHRL